MRTMWGRAMGARWLSTLGALALLVGCVPDDGGGEPEDDPDVGVDQMVALLDAEVDGADLEPDVALPDPDRGAPDVGADGGDMAPDEGLPPDEGPPPDEGMPLTIETCEDACGRYAECDRLDDRFGDYDACLRDCSRISRGGRPDEWFDCVELETCNLLRLCPVPAIEPLSCDEVCGLVGECGVDLAIPDCAGTCEENAETFRACGDLLFGGVCDGPGFNQCVVDQVFPECRALCDAGVACNLVRDEACIADCLDDRLSGDPLGALRGRQLESCVRFAADDCLAADACFFPPDPGEPAQADPDRFCQLYEDCGLGIFFTCDEMIRELGDDLACGQGLLQQGCPFDDFELLDACLFGLGPDPRAAPCGDLCEAREVCGLLPGDENQLACTQGCLGGGGADPDDQARADALLPCAGVDRCDDLVACIDASGPAAECGAFCQALDGCGVVEPNCLPDCDRDWPRDRHAARRACVAEAGDDCAAMAACAQPPPPPCAAYCDRIGPDDCGLDFGEGCVGQCDDAHFADPPGTLQDIACALTAPLCFGGERVDGRPPYDVEFCAYGDAPYGVDCLGFCRATTECAGDPDGLAECLVACGAGLVDDDGLRFLAARACLAALPADAACEAVEGCVPQSADADCDALCGRAEGCGIPLAECPARCAEDPLARLRALRGELCIAPEAACEEVDACILPPAYDPAVEVEQGLIGEAAFCAVFDGCPEAEFNLGDCGFLYQDLLDFVGPEGVACARDGLVICSPFLDEVFECFDGGGAEPSPIVEPCAVLCEAQRFCDPDAPAQRDCELECQGQVVPGDQDGLQRVVPQLQCGSAWSCPDLDACLDASTPEAICAADCAARAACGAVPDALDCEVRCLEDFSRIREIQRRACFAGVDPADCAAVAECEPPPPLPCDLACAALDACQLGVERCEPLCDDAGALDPAGEAQRIACLVAAGDDCEAVAACEADPGDGGGACFAWCRATTECAAEPVEDLPTCLTRCLVGFEDGDALRFAAAEPCLDDAGAGAACPDLLACVPAEAAVDCEAYCGALDDCRVPAEGCRADCAAEPDLAAAVCVADTLRTGGRCTGVAACVGYAPPPADAVCRGLCERRIECDPAVDPFLCRLDCTPTPPAGPFQLACMDFAGCDAELGACLALDDTPDPICVELCATAVDTCGLYPDAAACVAECTGREAAPQTDDGYLGRAEACFEDAVDAGGQCDAGAAESCLQPAFCERRDDLIYFAGPQGQIDTDTRGLPDAYASPCAGGGAAEAIIVINVEARSNLRAFIADADYDTALNLFSPCDGPNIACNDDDFNLPDNLWSSIAVVVEPGTYYLMVEGYSDNTGTATVDITVEAL